MVALRIHSAVLAPYRLGLDPEAGFGPYRDGFLLTLTSDDGSEFSGDVAPLPGFSRETHAEVTEEWMRMAARFRGADIPTFSFDSDERIDEFFRPIQCASLRFGLEQAMLGLTVYTLGTDLQDFIVGAGDRAIETTALVATQGASVIGEARRLVDVGYRTLKIKVGRRPVQQDAAGIAAIRDEVGPDVRIRVDANRSWSFSEAVEFVDRTPKIGFEFVEEPLADATQLLAFWEATGAPIGLDETLLDTPLDELERWAFISNLVLKPTLNGGIRITEQIVRKASSLGVRPVVSSAYESGIGTAFLALLAGRWCPNGPSAGIGTHRYLTSDLTSQPVGIGPTVHLADVSAATTFLS